MYKKPSNVVPDLLRDAAKIYEERNKMYGSNYKRFGPIMQMLFPDGLRLKSADDFNRFGIFVQVVAKITRYAENFTRGGHADSLDDMAVYGMMLRELDQDAAHNYAPRPSAQKDLFDEKGFETVHPKVGAGNG